MNNLSIHKKTFIILLIIWLIITSNLIKSTYAKYFSQLGTDANIVISTWNILLNDKNILDSDEMQNILSLTFPGNDYAVADVIVPGAEGYFDIVLDSSHTTVPFTVNISSFLDENSAYTDEFSVSSYSINDLDTIVPITDDLANISYDVTPNINETQIRVYLKWEDDGIAEQEDTELGITAESALVKVKIQLNQLILPDTTPDEPSDSNIT